MVLHGSPEAIQRRPGHVDDLQTGRPLDGRPRCRQIALPPARVERQLLQRSALKTLNYAPVFPDRSGSQANARALGMRFFSYYKHPAPGTRHSGIGLDSPASVHFGTAAEVRAQRQTMNVAYAAHPERFGNGRPQPPKLHTVAWINQPLQETLIQTAYETCLHRLDTFRNPMCQGLVHDDPREPARPPTGT